MRLVASAASGKARYDIMDDDLPGFGLRVYPTGAKTFILRYRPKGSGRAVNPRTYTIGPTTKLRLDEARDLARKALAGVADGKDPAHERPTSEMLGTVQKVLDGYLKALEGRASHRTVRSLFRLYVGPRLGAKVPAKLRRSDVLGMHEAIEAAGHKRTAGAAVTNLRAALAWAADRDLIVPPPREPTAGIKAQVWRRRKRVASADELARVLVAIRDLWEEGERWPWSLALLLALILTGARPGELRAARWTDLDRDRRVIVLTKHKTSEMVDDARVIHLSDQALAVIDRAGRVAGNPFIFAGRRKGQPVSGNYIRIWYKAIERAEVTGLTPYDLRRTFVSLGLGLSYSLDALGKAVGHSQASTTAGYAWLLPERKREIVEAIAAEVPVQMPAASPAGSPPKPRRRKAGRARPSPP